MNSSYSLLQNGKVHSNMIDITPNYELMMSIILVLWILVGAINILQGIKRTERTTAPHGSLDIIGGLLCLCFAAWVIFG